MSEKNPRMTKEIFEQAIMLALPSIELMMETKAVKRHHLQIYAGGVEEGILARESLGDKEEWTNPYSEVAMSKFKLTQEYKMPTRDIQRMMPHVLGKSGTTIWWGSWIEYGIIVACSGVEPWMDEMISKMIVTIIFGLMHSIQDNQFEEIKQSGEAFYPSGSVSLCNGKVAIIVTFLGF